MQTIAELVRENESNYNSGNTQISKYVNFSLKENIEKIDAYLNSKHISGETDSMGREKPFFNVVTSAVNIWYRATDIDRKDIAIKPTKKKEVIGAFLASNHLQSWMKKDNFGKFLNSWGRAGARYNSVVLKFVENDEGLHSEVVSWNRLIVDPIQFDNDVTIEVLELTPAKLRKKKGYDKKLVEQLIESVGTRETIEGQKKDTKSNFIKLFEVHGEMPKSYLTDNPKDNDTYVQQMQVISYVERKEKGKFDDYVLAKGKEEKHPYMITHLIEEEGRTMAIGAVENLFEAQWMQNHTSKAIKDQLDLASKLIFQTSDGGFVGQNAIDAIETGDILIHAVNQPLTQVANNSHDIAPLQSFQQQWKELGNEINNISESMLGATPKSGTAWRQTEAILQESHSLFETMIENKGIALEEMLRKYILPHIKKKMNNKDEIAVTLSEFNIEKINKMYIPSEARRRTNEKVRKANASRTLPNVDIEQEEEDIKNEVSNGVFLSPGNITWKELFKDLEWEVEVDISGEATDTQIMVETLNTTLQTLVGLAGQPMTPDMKLVFNKILTATGQISPLELDQAQVNQPKQITNEGQQTPGIPVQK